MYIRVQKMVGHLNLATGVETEILDLDLDDFNHLILSMDTTQK